MSKKVFLILLGMTLSGIKVFAQVICILCYQQTDSISSGVTNLLLNGGFENSNCPPNSNGQSFCPNSSNYTCNLANWTCTGGGNSTYSQVLDGTILSKIVEGNRAVYMGNAFCNSCSAATNDTSCLVKSSCEVTGIPAGYPYNQAAYGGTTGLSLEQTVSGLIPGNTYVLEFWAGGEQFGTSFDYDGVFAVDVGFGNSMLLCKPTLPLSASTGTRFLVEFNAVSISHTIRFTNWGHVCQNCTELVLDDIRLYTLAELDSSVIPCNVVQAPDVNLASSDTSWCDKKSIDFFDLSTNNPTTWDWYFQGATPDTSTQQNPQGIYYPSYGDFDVRLIACNTAGCDTLFLPAFIHEFQLPPSPVITSSFDTLFSTAAYAYQWYDSAGVIPGATNSYYVYQQQGSYFVIITDSNGCASSSGTINTGLEEQFSVSALTIFPNPSDGRFTVTSGLNHPGTSAIRLYDAWGRLVIQQVSATEKTNMVTDLPAGIYLLEWVLPGKIYRQRVLIQK